MLHEFPRNAAVSRHQRHTRHSAEPRSRIGDFSRYASRMYRSQSEIDPRSLVACRHFHQGGLRTARHIWKKRRNVPVLRTVFANFHLLHHAAAVIGYADKVFPRGDPVGSVFAAIVSRRVPLARQCLFSVPISIPHHHDSRSGQRVAIFVHNLAGDYSMGRHPEHDVRELLPLRQRQQSSRLARSLRLILHADEAIPIG